ncbi:MAG TPA: ROK family protein [Candidatus Saccharibacteria bacterium]|nr:ROK family protein [Candidatus Saccharibacteria bacterium]
MIVAIDTGGTKTLIVGFDKDGEVVDEIKFPTPKTPQAYTKIIRRTLFDFFGDKQVDAIAVGIPNMIKDGVALGGGNLHWKNFNVKAALAGSLGRAPVFVENDANLAGLAEVRQLKPLPKNALYVTVSTGIGGGIITDGHINPHFSTSEIGHMVIDFEGKAQRWETFGSGKAFFTKYKKYARDIKSKRTWGQIADRISRGFLVLVPTLQPSVIIIGGSIGTYFDHFNKELTTILKKKLPSIITVPKIIQAKNPELAVIYGCYYYALDSLAD